MASPLKLSFAFILLSLFILSSASDISTITYDDDHNMGGPSRSESETMALYESWLVKHGKVYNAIGEKEKLFEIFKDNLKFIDEHNSVNRPYKVGLNRFADMTNGEYRSMFVRGRLDRKARLMSRRLSNRYAVKEGEELPESVDWRAKGAIAWFKDHGECVGFGSEDSSPVCKSFHIVEGGDTCASVAQEFNMSLQDFLNINPNINCDAIFVGQCLCVDGST